MDWKLIVYGVWATSSVIVWGLVFRDDLAAFRAQRRLGRDRRGRTAFQVLLSDLALLLTAVACAISIATLVVGQDVPGLRGFMLALALGCFLGAGIVKVTLRERPKR